MSAQQLALGLILALPIVTGLACLRLAGDDPRSALRLSLGAALVLALITSMSAVGTRIPLPANRAIELTAVGQFGVEVLALVMLTLVLGLYRESPALIARWLPVSWLSLAGLVAALLITSLPMAVLLFLAATLIWVFGLPAADRPAARSAMLRYMALLVLTMPLLLSGFRVAEGRSGSALGIGIEALVLAFLAPGFGLVLGLIPLHGWTLTLASGAPRAMLFGVLALVQTAGYLLVIRTFDELPWLAAGAQTALLFGGALSVLVGGWLAVSARLDDPDDWLVYAAIASGGCVLVGLGSQTRAAAQGALLLILARVFALVLLALAPRVGPARIGRLAACVATLTLAGTPGLAGFPGLWLVLQPLNPRAAGLTQLAVLAGCGMLFATAVRRWNVSDPDMIPDDDPRTRRTAWLLMGLLLALGLLPGLILPALSDVLREMFLRQ